MIRKGRASSRPMRRSPATEFTPLPFFRRRRRRGSETQVEGRLRLRQAGFHLPLSEPPPMPEYVLDEDIEVEAWAAGIDSPSAVHGDLPGLEALPLCAGLIAIAERRVAAAEIGVALPQGRLGQSIRDSDGISRQQSVPQSVRLAENAHRFRIAEMRVCVHESDFAAEERSGFSSPKYRLRPSVIGERPVHETGAVGKEEMLANDSKMAPRLLRREKAAYDRLRHGDQRVGKARSMVARMKQQLRRAASGRKHAVAGDHAEENKEAIKVLVHRRGEQVVLISRLRAPDDPQDRGVATKLLSEKRYGPAARHPVAQGRIDRLERVVPVPVPVAQQMRAGDQALAHGRDQFVDVGRDRSTMRSLLKVVLAAPGDRFVEKVEIAGRFGVVADCLQWPDDDVPVRLFVLDGGVRF